MIRSLTDLQAAVVKGQKVDLRKLNNVLQLTSQEVKVEAGMKLRDLLNHLATNKLTLGVIPIEQDKTLVELLSEDSYSSGCELFSSIVNKVVTVINNGQMIESEDLNDDGVIYALHLRVVELYTLYQRRLFTQLPPDYLHWLSIGLYRQLYYNPYTNNALLYDHSPSNTYGPEKRTMWSQLLKSSTTEKITLKVYENLSILIPRFTDSLYKAKSGVSRGCVHKLLDRSEYNEMLQSEVRVPIDKAVITFERLKSLIEQWKSRGYYIPLGIHIRTIKNPRMVTFTFYLYPSKQSEEFLEEIHLE